jgi:hypothetical protein
MQAGPPQGLRRRGHWFLGAPRPALPLAVLALSDLRFRPMAVASPSTATKASPEHKLVASLIALLEAGTTPWRREWDAAAGGHHVNLLSGRRYRSANPVLLTLGMHLRGSALPF